MPFFDDHTYTPETDPGPATGTPDAAQDRRIFGSSPRQPIGVGPDGKYVYSEGSVAQETKRYQSLGEAAANRGAYQNQYGAAYDDRGRALEARGQQGAALGLMAAAANGQQPSQAAILGHNMIGQSLNAQMAAGASARGGSLAQAAAMRQAALGADAFRQQGTQQIAALRAQEMAQARGDYMQGASAMRGQDYGAASQAAQMAQAQAQNEMFQRQLNQQGRQWYEGRRYDVLAGDQEAALKQQAIETGQAQFAAQMDQHDRDRSDDMVGAFIGGGATLGSAAIKSDLRSKMDVVPLGVNAGKGGGAMGIGQAAAARGTPYVGFDITRDDPYGVDPYSAGMAMRQPTGFGPGMTMTGAAAEEGQLVSDARAKQEAYLLGRSHQSALESTGGFAYQSDPDLPPEVVNNKDLYNAAMAHRGMQQSGGRQMGPITREMVSGQPVTPGDRLMSAASDGAAQGAATGGPLAQAARSMTPVAYKYKPQFAEPGRNPNEVYVGPADAKKMETDPVAGTAVSVNPATGMRQLDKDKLLRLNSAIVSNQQQQIDSLAAAVAKRKGAK